MAEALLLARGITWRAARASDPGGALGRARVRAHRRVRDARPRALARLFDQFAYYEVTGAAVVVRDARDGARWGA